MTKVLGNGTNVDELKTPGIYKSSTSAVTATLTGTLPEGFTNGFYMEVIGDNPYIQTLSNFNGDLVYRRGFVGNAWTTWKQVMF